MTNLTFNKEQTDLLKVVALSELPVIVQGTDRGSRELISDCIYNMNGTRHHLTISEDTTDLDTLFNRHIYKYPHKAIINVFTRKGKGIEKYHKKYYLIKVFKAEEGTPYFNIQVVTHQEIEEEEIPTLKLTLKDTSFIAYTINSSKAKVNLKYNKGTQIEHLNIRVNCEETLNYALNLIKSSHKLYELGKELSKNHVSNIATILIFDMDKLRQKDMENRIIESLTDLEELKAVGLSLVFENSTDNLYDIGARYQRSSQQVFNVRDGRVILSSI